MHQRFCLAFLFLIHFFFIYSFLLQHFVSIFECWTQNNVLWYIQRRIRIIHMYTNMMCMANITNFAFIECCACIAPRSSPNHFTNKYIFFVFFYLLFFIRVSLHFHFEIFVVVAYFFFHPLFEYSFTKCDRRTLKPNDYTFPMFNIIWCCYIRKTQWENKGLYSVFA